MPEPEVKTEEVKAAEAKAASDAAAKAKGADTGDVTLTGVQYNAILDRMQELEEGVLEKRRKGPLSVDELADEVDERGGKKPTEGAPDPRAIEQMTNTQLIGYIFQAVEKGIGQPLLVKLEEMRVKDEIKELRKDLGENDDFDDLRDEIYKVAVRNPNLSIKEAYRLAKKEEGSKTKKKGENEDEEEATPVSKKKKRDVLFSLPSRVKTQSEKPTHTRGTTHEGAPETRMDAAKRAIEDLEKTGVFG